MKKMLNRLFEHEKLIRDEAKEVLSKIAAEEYNDVLLDLCLKVDLEGVKSIDLYGTGADGKNTFNMTTLHHL